jgi:hypothetical protein
MAWLRSLPEPGPEAYLFPRHAVGFAPEGQGTTIYNIDFRQPMQGWKTAWRRALEGANVKARWHDLRHSLVSRLAEQPTVSEETIRALDGHVSRQMLSRYAHIRASSKRSAIASLETGGEGITKPARATNLGTGSPQKSPQFVEGEKILLERQGPQLLNCRALHLGLLHALYWLGLAARFTRASGSRCGASSCTSDGFELSATLGGPVKYAPVCNTFPRWITC